MRKTLADEKVKLESKKLKKLSAIVYAKDSKCTEGWAEFWDIANKEFETTGQRKYTKADYTKAKQGKWDEKKQCHAVKDGCGFCGLLPTGGAAAPQSDQLPAQKATQP